MKTQDWTPESLVPVQRSLADSSPREILRWGLDTFGDGIVMATGFGPSGVVLAHLLSRLHPGTTVFYLDTDLLFPETLTLRDQLAERLGLSFTRVHSGVSLERQARQYGPELWANNPDRCCFVRKVLPLRRFLAGKEAWITGLRRDQSAARAQVEPVEWDTTHGLVKLNPLARWTADDVWSYIQMNELPYNTLHDRGYPSIGCKPCTHPVAHGEDERAGRWRGQDKTECGIHSQLHQFQAA
jgi:phosphoadenosine phosphosulfate reductase